MDLEYPDSKVNNQAPPTGRINGPGLTGDLKGCALEQGRRGGTSQKKFFLLSLSSWLG
jgi:hypothetical protein